MFTKRCMLIGLSLILGLGVVLTASAAPTPTPKTTPKPKLLDQIIEGAKKEGEVSIMLRSGYTVESIARLKKEIKELFGVDLKIKFTPSGAMATKLAQAIMEHRAGIPPSLELLDLSTDYLAEGIEAGIWAEVDWKALITKDTNPGMLIQFPLVSPVTTTNTAGLMYNPEKVPAGEVPKSLEALANPKWKRKVGFRNYPHSWGRMAYFLGKERVIAAIRAMLKNGAIPGEHSDLFKRYAVGEIWTDFTNSNYYQNAVSKGLPAAYTHPGFVAVSEGVIVVQRGAKHPNAARLVAVYLASPAGAKFSWETARYGNLYYPGFEHDFIAKSKAEGIEVRFDSRDKGLQEFLLTAEYKKWMEEINMVIKGGK